MFPPVSMWCQQGQELPTEVIECGKELGSCT